MIEVPDFGRLTEAQLFVIARLAQLRADGYTGYLPSWVVEKPLEQKPFELDEEAIANVLVALATLELLDVEQEPSPGATVAETGSAGSGAAEVVTEAGASQQGERGAESGDAQGQKDGDESPELNLAASELCMRHVDALQSEAARRAPALPDDLPSLLLLADANARPGGFDSGVIMQALEDPPGCLTRAEGVERYHRLMDGFWIFAVERSETEWFPSPAAWGREQEIRDAVSRCSGEMRSRLADGIAVSLELPENAPLRDALRSLDRAHFVPDAHRHLAYRNRPVPIWNDTERDWLITTSSPSVCAMIASKLDLSVGDRVLVCGVKGGFTASLCAHIVGPRGRVVCLEDRAEIVEFARAAVERSGLARRIEIRLVRDVTVGLEDQEPWDAVVVNGKIPKVPRPIIRQMRDGGRLLLFLQNIEDNAQTAYLVRKNGSVVEHQAMSTFSFTPIYGEYGFDPPNWQENLSLVGQEGHEIFLSYSTRDQMDCDRIVAALEDAGVRCWMSGRDHPVGRDGYETAIMAALQKARLFLIVLSHNSVGSDHVKNELTNATNLRKIMLPVKLEECPLRLPSSFQYHLERHQQFDLVEHSLERVAGAALQLLEKKPKTLDDATPAAAAMPTNAEGSNDQLDETLRFVLRDGRITRSEMLLLLEEARGKWPGLTEAEVRSRLEHRARELQPEAQFER